MEGKREKQKDERRECGGEKDKRGAKERMKETTRAKLE